MVERFSIMKTNSWAFPNMINVAQNKVEIIEDEKSITSRDRLLILTEPTEIYNEPTQGVGLKKYLWQYNNENTKARLKDEIINKLREYEPYCIPEDTQFEDGNIFTGSMDSEISQKYNTLELTIGIKTTFGQRVDITFSDIFES